MEEPPNVCTPAHLADIAGKIAALAPERFELKVLLRPEVEALKMGLFLGGAQNIRELCRHRAMSSFHTLPCVMCSFVLAEFGCAWAVAVAHGSACASLRQPRTRTHRHR